MGGERPRASRRPARPPGCPSVLSRARMPHLLQGEKEELLGQQLRVQQQLGVRAAATAHIPRHGRRQETPGWLPTRHRGGSVAEVTYGVGGTLVSLGAPEP